MIGQNFHSNEFLHPQLNIFVYISWLLLTTCALVQTAFSIPILLLTYEFPNYIAKQKNLTNHKLIYRH